MADNWLDSPSRTRTSSDSVNLLQGIETTASVYTDGSTGDKTRLHIMGLGLSSESAPHSLDWNQALLYKKCSRVDHQKNESGFLNLLHDQDSSLSSHTSNLHLKNNKCPPQRMHPASSLDSTSEFMQNNVGNFALGQPKQGGDNESIISCQGSHHQQQVDFGFYQNQGMCSFYQSNYGDVNLPGGDDGGGGEFARSRWSKFSPQSQELEVTSPSKVQLAADIGGHQLHFVNNTRLCNASTDGVNSIRSSSFPPLQMQLPLSCFEDKSKISSKILNEITSESSTKRPRDENELTLPVVKVRKEKMGDRITALQQLLSPFGKTDTASVLSETTEYIKFLHEQISVLSTPYMKKRPHILQQQQQPLQHTPDKQSEGPTQDLRSHGLCLVPVLSTFPVTCETPVDFWTPRFAGTFG